MGDARCRSKAGPSLNLNTTVEAIDHWRRVLDVIGGASQLVPSGELTGARATFATWRGALVTARHFAQ